jgi:hypothetical protein
MKRPVRPVDELPFDAVLAQTRALRKVLAPFDLGLTAKERNRRLKMPSKSADAIRPLLLLAKRHGLDAHAAPIAEHRRALDKLAELQNELTIVQIITSGLFMTSESETWKATTTIYTMLRRLARSDPDLAHALRPVVTRYFARKKADGPEEPAAPAAATASPKKKAPRRG